MRHPHIVSLGCWYLHNNACDFPSATDKSPCVELPIFCGSPFSRQVMAASALTVLGEHVSRRGRGCPQREEIRHWSLIMGREGGYNMGKSRVRNFLHPPLLKSGNLLRLSPPPPPFNMAKTSSYHVKTTSKLCVHLPPPPRNSAWLTPPPPFFRRGKTSHPPPPVL